MKQISIKSEQLGPIEANISSMDDRTALTSMPIKEFSLRVALKGNYLPVVVSKYVNNIPCWSGNQQERCECKIECLPIVFLLLFSMCLVRGKWKSNRNEKTCYVVYKTSQKKKDNIFFHLCNHNHFITLEEGFFRFQIFIMSLEGFFPF